MLVEINLETSLLYYFSFEQKRNFNKVNSWKHEVRNCPLVHCYYYGVDNIIVNNTLEVLNWYNQGYTQCFGEPIKSEFLFEVYYLYPDILRDNAFPIQKLILG
jgi:hypothetical protein